MPAVVAAAEAAENFQTQTSRFWLHTREGGKSHLGVSQKKRGKKEERKAGKKAIGRPWLLERGRGRDLEFKRK